MNTSYLLPAICMTVLISITNGASAQVAGSTTVSVSVTEASRLALGWSVKKNIMGKAIYNEQKEKIGIVEDLIIAPDKSVSYLIIGAGGFVGIGRHDVAIPITQVIDQNGRLVMPGATKDMVKSMPRFDYATETAKRDQFIAFAEQDIAKAKAKIAELEKKATTANADAKQKLDQQIVAMKLDVASAEDKLATMKNASAKKWKEFEVNVNAATARLRKWIETLAN